MFRPLRQGGRGAFAGQTVIFAVHAGGLGDHLAYSALPRLYKAAGAAKVLLSSRTNAGEPCTRNPEILALVWTRNPFLDGVTDAAPTVGEMGWPPARYFAAAKTAGCPVDTVAAVHGLAMLRPDGTRTLPTRPDLFYQPRDRPELRDVVLCDPRSTSQGFYPTLFDAFARHVARWHGFDMGEMAVVESRHAGQHGAGALPDCRRIMVRDIFDYADAVAGAKAFLVTEAGGQSLAAALRTDATYVLTTTRAYNERNFLWPGNTYCVTGGMTPDAMEWP